MRRAAVWFASIGVLVVASGLAWAQRQPTPPPTQQAEPETKFERFVLKKGVVLVREFYRVGVLGDDRAGGQWAVVRAFSPGDKQAALALRIEIKRYVVNAQERIGLLDADEVLSLRAALPRLHQMFQSMRKDAPYTEVEFLAGNVRVGFFGPDGPSFFVQLRNYPDEMIVIAPDHFKDLDEVVQQAATKIEELQRR